MDENVLGRIGRRQVLRAGGLGAAGLAAAALIGCGGGDNSSKPAATASSAAANATQAAGPGKFVKDPNLPYPYQFPDPPGTPKKGGVLKLATTYDISIYDPAKAIAGGTLQVTNFVYNRLIGFKIGPEMDPFKNELVPEVAKSWETTPDGMVYTFKLAPNVKFQNLPPLSGRAFTSSDVKFAYERYKAGGPSANYFANVDHIDAPDPGTVKITMKRAVADFIVPLAGRYLTLFPHELVDDGSIEKKAVGTGPMILKEAVGADHVTYERNADYWERPILLDGFELRIMPDAAARLAAMRASQVDYAQSPVDTLSGVKNLEKSNPGVQVQMGAVTYPTFTLAMNLQLPKYQDDRVRRALSLGMDRQSLVQIQFEGLGKILPTLPWTFVMDKEPAAADLGPYMKYDAAEAKKLLDAAGATNLTLKSVYFAYSASNQRTSEQLTDQLRKVGVTLEDRSIEYTQFNSQWTTGKLEDATTSGWQTVGYDADNFFYTQINSKSPGNRWRTNDPQLDQWSEQQQVELNPQQRREIQKKMWDYELDKMYRIPLPAQLGFQIFQPWVRGVRSSGAFGGSAPTYDDGSMVRYAWLDK